MAVAATTIASPGSQKNPKLLIIPDISIDKKGNFKYVLLKVHDPDKDREFKHIVRGYSKHEYHADIYNSVAPGIEETGLDCECVGGGRISIDSGKKFVQVSGYSEGFGRADHAITAAIIRRKFKNHEVAWSNDSY